MTGTWGYHQVGAGVVPGTTQITQATFPPAPSADPKLWFIETLTFSAIGGTATITIDASDKDCNKVYAGDADSLGTDFVVPVASNDEFSLHVTTSAAATVLVWPIPNGPSEIPFTFPASSTSPIPKTAVTFGTYAALHVRSTVEVSVYAIVNLTGLHILPTDVLGPDHVMAVSTTTAGTSCSLITLNKQLSFEVGNQGEVTADAYTVKAVTPTPSDDPRRNILHSNKPAALFCRNHESGSSGDLVQIPPLELLGTVHYIPAIDLTACDNALGSIKITCVEDSTHVFVRGSYDTDYMQDAAGDIVEATLESNVLYSITTNKPVLVAVVLKGGSATAWTSASVIPPVEQYTQAHVFPAWSGGVTLAHSTAVMNNGSSTTSLIVNVNTAIQPVAYSTPTFSMTILKDAKEFYFVVQSDIKYNDINAVCTLSPSTAADNIDNDCDGLTDEEVCTSIGTAGLVDTDIDGNINEDCSTLTVNLTTVVTINLPSTPMTCTPTPGITTTPAPTTPSPTGPPTTAPDSPGCCCGLTLDPDQMTEVSNNLGVTWVTSNTVSTSQATTQASQATTQATTYPTSTQATVGTTDAKAETCLTDCICPCAWMNNVTLTEEEVTKLVEKVQEKLKVNKAILSATIRKLTSAKDDRPSAMSIGYIGLAFLVVTLGTVFLLDITTIVRDLRLLRDNLRAMFDV